MENSCFLCGAPDTLPIWKWSHEQHLSLVHAPDSSVTFSICQSCGLVRQTPFLSDALIKKMYTEINLEAQNTDFDERYHWLCLALGCEPKAGHLLDVGCSEGKQAQIFIDRGWKISGIEPSIEAGAIAAGKGIHVFHCPVEEAELENDEFDVIIFFHLLEHLKNPRCFLQQMIRSLKEGGLLYLEIPNLHRPWGNLVFFFPGFHYYVFGPDHIERLLIEEGMEILRGEAAVNQRWLARKSRGASPKCKFEPVKPQTVINTVLVQGLAVNIAKMIVFWEENPNRDVPQNVRQLLLEPDTRRYIQHQSGFLQRWHSQWLSLAKTNPLQSTLELITMLYYHLDTLQLMLSCGFGMLSESEIYYWGRIIQYRAFYQDSFDRLAGRATLGNLQGTHRVILKLVSVLERLLKV